MKEFKDEQEKLEFLIPIVARYRIFLMKYLDVIVDGPYIDELRDISLKWRGSLNQRVIDTQQSLNLNQVVLWCD